MRIDARRFAAALILAAVVAFPPIARASARALVLPFMYEPELKSAAEQIEDTFRGIASASGRFDVPSKESMAAIVAETTADLVPVFDVRAGSRLAMFLMGDYFFMGAVRSRSGSLEVEIAYVDVLTQEELKRLTVKIDDPANARPVLETLFADLIRKEARQEEARAPATLAITTEPPEADVYLDGELKGRTPFVANAAPGWHQVHIRKPQYVDKYGDMQLESGKVQTFTLTLEQVRPITTSMRPSSPPPRVDYERYEAADQWHAVIQSAVSIANCLDFSPDGRFILTGGDTGELIVWTLDAQIVRKWSIGDAPVTSVRFSPDGGSFVFASGYGDTESSVSVWRVDGSVLLTLGHFSSTVNAVAFSPDGACIAAASGKTIRVWRLDGAPVCEMTGHGDDVDSIAFSPRGNRIVSGSSDKTVRTWDLEGRLLQTMEGHSGFVDGGVAYSPDGKLIASGSMDDTVKVWTEEGRLLRTLQGHRDAIQSVAFSPNGQCLVTADRLGDIRVWSLEGALLGAITAADGLRAVALSPDGEFLAVSTYLGLSVWKTDGTLAAEADWRKRTVNVVAASPHGGFFAAGSLDGKVALWGPDLSLKKAFLCNPDGKEFSSVQGMAFSPDGQSIATASTDRLAALWDLKGSLVRAFRAHDRQVNDVAFSPDGSQLASASDDGSVIAWNADGSGLKVLEGHTDKVNDVRVSPKGDLIASCSHDGTIRLWKPDGTPVKSLSLEKEWPVSLAFSPDGRNLLCGTGGWSAVPSHLLLWDLESGKTTRFPETGTWVSVAFSPDGKTFASAASVSAEGAVLKIWDVQGSLLKTFEGPGSSIHSLAYSADGKYVVAGMDNAAVIRRLDNGECVTLLAQGDEWIVYTPDGYFDASINGGDLIRMSRGFRTVGIEQFAVRNNRPDIILQRMGLGAQDQIVYYHSLFLKRLRKLGLAEGDLSTEEQAPLAQITDMRVDGKRAEIRFTLRDPGHRILSYNIWVNGVPILGAYGSSVPQGRFDFAEKVELTAGQNKIEVSCMNEKGVESFRALRYAEYNAVERGDLYYLGMGVSDYRSPQINDLSYAAKDATDLEAAFKKMNGVFRAIHTLTLTDSKVTVGNIKRAKDFLSSAKPEDVLVLFIAGHGVHGTDPAATYYYVTWDAELSNLAGTAADFDLIEGLLQGIGPRRKLFLMDTCESGELDDEEASPAGGEPGAGARVIGKDALSRGLGIVKIAPSVLRAKDRYICNDLVRRSGAIVFSSCLGSESSFESDEYQNGYFTTKIKEALSSKAADVDGDGAVSTDELRAYVSAAVPKISDNLQHPTVDRDNLYVKFELPQVPMK